MVDLLIVLSAFAVFLAAIVVVLRKIQEVHVLVNQRMADALARIEQLGNALRDKGIAIPRDPHDRQEK
jgi:type II secretory pathway component PulJ